MPNHVANRITFIGKKTEINALLEYIRSEEESFDFNKVIPMPDELEGISSPPRIISEAEYETEMRKLNLDKIFPKEKSEYMNIAGRGITEAMQKDFILRYGTDNWYDWNRQNWETKWGAYNTQEPEIYGDENETTAIIEYDTAWSTSINIPKVISGLFPNVRIGLVWADEDVSYNTGTVKFLNGETEDFNEPQGESREAFELYLDLHEFARDEFRLNEETGKYEYIGDEDDEE